MTLTELQQRFPDATAETWHQHPNGGGWVENTATVAPMAYVGPDAVVRDRAVVGDSAVVRAHAVVEGRSVVEGSSVVEGCSVVGGCSVVEGCSVVGGCSVVEGCSVVGGCSVLTCGVWTESPLYMQGTRHSLNMDGNGRLRIGCLRRPIAWWLENNVRCGEEHGYTPEQIAEYRRYIELAAAMYGSGQ